MPSCSVSVVCSLFVHHVFPNSNCLVHARALSSHGGRLLPFHSWISGRGIPVPVPALAGARMVGILDGCFLDQNYHVGNLNGVPRREGSRTRSRPRHCVETDGASTGTSMWHHLWSHGCSRAHPCMGYTTDC